MVFWNYRRWVVIFPGLLYLAHVCEYDKLPSIYFVWNPLSLAISIPLLLTTVQSGQPFSSPPRSQIIYYSLHFSFNLVLTILICLRIFMMRHKAVKVLGKLQASFYVSLVTLCVESGAFFTIWSMVYLICFLRNSWVQDVFLQPYSYILVSYCLFSQTWWSSDWLIFQGNYQNTYSHENGSRSRLVQGHHLSNHGWRTRLADFFNENHPSWSFRTVRLTAIYIGENYRRFSWQLLQELKDLMTSSIPCPWQFLKMYFCQGIIPCTCTMHMIVWAGSQMSLEGKLCFITLFRILCK